MRHIFTLLFSIKVDITSLVCAEVELGIVLSALFRPNAMLKSVGEVDPEIANHCIEN